MRHNHWTFGNNDHIEFPNGQGPPQLRSNSTVETYEGCATISDDMGNLLAYTDGVTLWDAVHAPINVVGLGGHGSSTSSAIIVPPAGTGTHYHVFAVGDDVGTPAADPVRHTTFRPQGGSVAQVISSPVDLIPPLDNTERIAAVLHNDGSRFWVLAQATGGAPFTTWLVDGDATPSVRVTSVTAQQGTQLGSVNQGYAKFSPDGTLFAWAGGQSNHISVHHFDDSTGMLTDYFTIVSLNNPYGLEFSPNSNVLYFSEAGPDFGIRGYDITSRPANLVAVPRNQTLDKYGPGSRSQAVGALQRGPNGVIYGKIGLDNTLLSISNTDDLAASVVNPSAVTLANRPTQRGRQDDGNWGLPVFTSITESRPCDEIADEVDDLLADQAANDVNRLAPCDGSDPADPKVDDCVPLQMDEVIPQISIGWGDSACDCIESDDFEVMTLTVCNPFSNVSFTNFTIYRLKIVDDLGNPVAVLPDGTPSVELVPLGPYCFGELAPCSCVSREFTLRNRGAESGPYHIELEGACFDVCSHQMTTACFVFEICAD